MVDFHGKNVERNPQIIVVRMALADFSMVSSADASSRYRSTVRRERSEIPSRSKRSTIAGAPSYQ
jgi:hypothetical protein